MQYSELKATMVYIHALADSFTIIKILNKFFGVIAGERLLYLSLNLVVLYLSISVVKSPASKSKCFANQIAVDCVRWTQDVYWFGTMPYVQW